MLSTCPDCGAPLLEADACRDYFHELLLLESRVPGAAGGVPHFLAVATYNLQHPSAFMPAALAGLRRSVREVLNGSAKLEDARRRARAADGAARVLRRADAHLSAEEQTLLRRWPRRWPVTVLDVCRVPPEQYVERVQEWAQTVTAGLDAEIGPD